MKVLLTSLLLSLAFPAFADGLPPEVSNASEAIARLDGNAKVRLINVWATWCAPCVVEMRDLEELHRTFNSRGLAIMGISVDDLIPGERAERKAIVARFLEARSISFQNVYYTGKAQGLADELDFHGEIPVTILYDRCGNEIARVRGAIVKTELEEKLRELLGERK